MIDAILPFFMIGLAGWAAGVSHKLKLGGYWELAWTIIMLTLSVGLIFGVV